MTSPIETETFRRAFDFALDNLIVALKEAQDYPGGGNDMAAIGTLADIEYRFHHTRLIAAPQQSPPHQQSIFHNPANINPNPPLTTTFSNHHPGNLDFP